jgi:hypothetical protein
MPAPLRNGRATRPHSGIARPPRPDRGVAVAYHYRFEFARGAGHVDKNVVTSTLAEAMLWLWRGYPIQ